MKVNASELPSMDEGRLETLRARTLAKLREPIRRDERNHYARLLPMLDSELGKRRHARGEAPRASSPDDFASRLERAKESLYATTSRREQRALADKARKNIRKMR